MGKGDAGSRSRCWTRARSARSGGRDPGARAGTGGAGPRRLDLAAARAADRPRLGRVGRETPLLDTTRARTELGWTPQYDAAQALLETVDAMSAGRGGSSPVLRPRSQGGHRLLEVVRALVPGAKGTG